MKAVKTARKELDKKSKLKKEQKKEGLKEDDQYEQKFNHKTSNTLIEKDNSIKPR